MPPVLRVIKAGAVTAEINAAIAAQKGAANGVAPLDAASKVPALNSLVSSVAGRGGAVVLGVADVSDAVATTDGRLSDPRTPTAHAASHSSASADAVNHNNLAGLATGDLHAQYALTDGTRLRVFRATTPPPSPGIGQVWEDTTTSPATLKHWNGTAWVSPQTNPIDASVTDAKVSTAAAIAETKLALASDAAAGTASRRTLGTGATQAAAGNDVRLSDARTPTDGSVTDAKVAVAAAIAESKLALASDAAAGTASRRTLGTGATQAAAGNDVRLRLVRDEGTALTNRANLNFVGAGVAATDNATTGATDVTITGASASLASPTVSGTLRSSVSAQDPVALEASDPRLLATRECEATRSTDIVVPNNAFTPLAFNAENADPQNWHDNATNPSRITPGQAGVFDVYVFTFWTANTTGIRGQAVALNGLGVSVTDPRAFFSSAVNGSSFQNNVFRVRLAATDYLEAYSFQNSGGDLALKTGSKIHAVRVL